LSGVWRVAPVVTLIGVVSAASMAAVPPLFGFVAKEAIYTALWYEGGWHRAILVALVAGSILSVAYSWRFVAGSFGPAPGAPQVDRPAIPALFWLPPAAVALATVGLPVVAGPLEELLRGYSAAVPTAESHAHLVVVPDPGVPLLASA